MKQFFLASLEILEVVLISLFTVYIIRSFLVQPFLVSGASMEPNFSDGNYLLIDEITYRFREPERGEVVVFRYPGDTKTFYIKRIIGLPGERVVIQSGGVRVFNKAYADGFRLPEDYIASGVMTLGDVDRTLARDEYFVLGDNRYFSFDSRNWGVLPRADIIGIARLRLLPVREARTFETPSYVVGQ